VSSNADAASPLPEVPRELCLVAAAVGCDAEVVAVAGGAFVLVAGFGVDVLVVGVVLLLLPQAAARSITGKRKSASLRKVRPPFGRAFMPYE